MTRDTKAFTQKEPPRCMRVDPCSPRTAKPYGHLQRARSCTTQPRRIHADGAGLHKRPEGVSYTNKYIPTLVAATHPTQTHTVTLLGHDITITLRATNYTWSCGDGTPDLTTTEPGMPWQEGMDPNTDPALIRHYYKAPNGWKSLLDGPYPSATRTITLTSTWAGTATNPFTGDTQTINGLITTTETTGPFPLGQLIVNDTDTWEKTRPLSE